MIKTKYYTNAMDIINAQNDLENTLTMYKTIHSYMVHVKGIDYNKNPIYRELEQILNETMINLNGYWVTI